MFLAAGKPPQTLSIVEAQKAPPIEHCNGNKMSTLLTRLWYRKKFTTVYITFGICKILGITN
jgi:hypothetical protein